MRAISNSRASGEAIIGDVPNAELRGDLLPFAVGVLLLTVGLVAAAAGLLRHRSRATVLYFGGACALYGLRLAADTQPAQILIHAPPSFWLRLIASVTYLITVPVAFEALAGPGTAMRPYVYLMLGNQGLGIWALTRPDFPVNRELRAVQVAYLILVIFS